MSLCVNPTPLGLRLFRYWSSAGLFSATLSHPTGAWKHAAFMPGCALASSSPHLVRAVYDHLSRSLPGMGLLLQCCAAPALSDTELFARRHAGLEREMEAQGLDTIVTACAQCYATLKKTSPHLNLRSLYAILLETGVPDRDHSAMPLAALHDPCPTRGEQALHRQVRALLAGMRYPWEEFGLNRERTLCCGNGGMLALRDPRKARAMARARCAQTECGVVVSYCQACVDAMRTGGKQGLHLLDLIFSETPRATRSMPGTARRWLNRYRLKSLIRAGRT